MKRLLFFIPVIFLVFLDACGNVGSSTVPPGMSTAVIWTLTAAMWTPVPNQTFNPNMMKDVM